MGMDSPRSIPMAPFRGYPRGSGLDTRQHRPTESRPSPVRPGTVRRSFLSTPGFGHYVAGLVDQYGIAAISRTRSCRKAVWDAGSKEVRLETGRNSPSLAIRPRRQPPPTPRLLPARRASGRPAVVEARRLGFAAKSVGVAGRETATATGAIGFATEAPEVDLLRLLGLPNSPADSTMAISGRVRGLRPF